MDALIGLAAYLGACAFFFCLGYGMGTNAHGVTPGFRCPHSGDPRCERYGCPDDPGWAGDSR